MVKKPETKDECIIKEAARLEREKHLRKTIAKIQAIKECKAVEYSLQKEKKDDCIEKETKRLVQGGIKREIAAKEATKDCKAVEYSMRKEQKLMQKKIKRG